MLLLHYSIGVEALAAADCSIALTWSELLWATTTTTTTTKLHAGIYVQVIKHAELTCHRQLLEDRAFEQSNLENGKQRGISLSLQVQQTLTNQRSLGFLPRLGA